MYRVCFLTDMQFGLYQALYDFIQTPKNHLLLNDLGMQLRQFTQNDLQGREKKLFQEAISILLKLYPQPDALVFGGDAIHDPRDPLAYKSMLSCLKSLPSAISTHWVAGNHDLCNNPPHHHHMDLTSYQQYLQRHGRDHTFWERPEACFATINSQALLEEENFPEVYQQQMLHLEKTIQHTSKSRHKRLILFSHHPWLSKKDKAPVNAEFKKPIDLINHFPKVHVVLIAGHDHYFYERCKNNIRQQTVTSVGCTFGKDPSGFLLLDIDSTGIHTQKITLPLGKTYFDQGPMPL